MTRFSRNIRRRLLSRHQSSLFRHTLIPTARRAITTLHHTCKVVLGFQTSPPHHSKQSLGWLTPLLLCPEVPTTCNCTVVTVMAALEVLAALSVLTATVHTRALVVTILVLDRNSAGSLNDPGNIRTYMHLFDF